MQEKKKTEERAEIDWLDLLKAVFHKGWIILVAAAVVGILTFCYCKFFVTPQYTSETTIIVLSRTGSGESVTYQDSMFSLQIMKDYERIIKSRSVAEKVISDLGLEISPDALINRIQVNSWDNTRVVGIDVSDPDPELAQKMADAVRVASSEQIKTVLNADAVNMVDPADLPSSPSSPRVLRTTAVGALIGALLALIVLVILYMADNTIKSSDDIEKYLELPTLALIPQFEEDGNSKKQTAKRAAVTKIR